VVGRGVALAGRPAWLGVRLLLSGHGCNLGLLRAPVAAPCTSHLVGADGELQGWAEVRLRDNGRHLQLLERMWPECLLLELLLLLLLLLLLELERLLLLGLPLLGLLRLRRRRRGRALRQALLV
jgi:hypothetical protein